MPTGRRYIWFKTCLKIFGPALIWLGLLSLMSGMFPVRSPAQVKQLANIMPNSYHPRCERSDKEAAGLIFRFREHYHTIEPLMECLDAKRFPGLVPQQLASYLTPKFDYRQLSLPMSALPVVSEVINEPQTFYSQDKKLLWTAAGIVAALGLVIVILAANILKRRWAERALVQSEGRYHTLFNHFPIPIWEEDYSAIKEFFGHLRASGVQDFRRHFIDHPEDVIQCYGLIKILAANQTILDIFQVRTKEELRQHMLECFKADIYHVFIEGLIGLAEGKTDFSSEIIIRTPSGEKKLLNMFAMIFPGNEETMSRSVNSLMDITRAKLTEDLLRASLREKEVLLQEVHHRVKNNLQIISSLLDLQQRNWEGKTPEDLIKDCQNRVRAMALIHDSLYRSTDLASIDFRAYLEKLMTRLLSIYSLDGHTITGEVAGDRFDLDLNRAIPCALLANELIVNCLKHAFPESGVGEIWVSLTTTGDRRVLTVGDNGVGLPENFRLEGQNTLGWRIIYDLVQQLQGTIEIQSNGGFTCTVFF